MRNHAVTIYSTGPTSILALPAGFPCVPMVMPSSSVPPAAQPSWRAWRRRHIATKIGNIGAKTEHERTHPRCQCEAQLPLERIFTVYANAVATPSARLAVLLGSPGLGKSRLVAEFTPRASDRATVLTAPCDDAGGGAFENVAMQVTSADMVGLFELYDLERAWARFNAIGASKPLAKPEPATRGRR